ncbi:MAG: hypothetical protein ACXABG_11665, partial [Promethearchaeota archaeon]
MAKNYLIGIGGTGAKVIEAFVYICAAGYGPEELTVFMIDPDAGNGNLTRTKTLVSNYNDCKKSLETTSDIPLFKTQIIFPDPLVWEIFDKKDTTLANYINYHNLQQTKKDLADFVTLLFSKSELDTPLNEGFRGHPSIGSVVMSTPPLEENPWKILWDEIESSSKPNELRVFLAGSVFGGTGAAGVPTIGSLELLKFNQSSKIGDKSKILLGGALVLPYFTFEIDKETEETMFVTGNDFPIATKAALQYYDEKDLGFDQLYLIGDSLGQKVGKFSPGSGSQENRSHYIEIVTALAANDFYEQKESESISEKKYFTACRADQFIRW